MVHPPPPPLGKLAGSQVKSFLFNPMGRCGVQQGARWFPRSSVEKPMAACAWCMRPASAVATLAHCARSANGRATLPRNRARSVSSCILWPLVRLLCDFERGEPEASSAGVHPSAASPTCAGADGIWHFSQSTSLACAPVPHAAGALSSRLAGALRSQRASKSESGDDQTVRHLGSVCHLARTGNGLTPFCQPLGIPLLGQACFSEWSLMAFFSGCSSISYGLRNEL